MQIRSTLSIVLITLLGGCGMAAEHQAKQWVAGMMKDPGSAKFDGVKTIGEGRDMLACGRVNAKNGYGGYAGFRSFMLYERMIYVASDEAQDIGVRRCCEWIYNSGKAGAKSVAAAEREEMCGGIGFGNYLPLD